ncbi:MAG: sigma-70 family RNA polymerase sigma factor [Tannerella sp.]|jgi:RNA polymerase sigma factor (sigma-70 family)|nr:sigma-70 family RNA polymerase sigma factor [Tannerella sp.]
MNGRKKTEEMGEQPEKQDAGKLIAEYQPRLKAFIRKRISNHEDAEDILQDVFYQLVKAVENTLNPIVHVEAWLYRVARNMIVNHAAKKREEELYVYQDEENDDEIFSDFSNTLFNEETSPSPETEYLRSLVWTELESALSELPSGQREIFELTELDGIPLKEIARTTGVAVNTLLSRKRYAVLYLRKRLSLLYEDLLCS